MAMKPIKGIEITDDAPVIETLAESKDFSVLASEESFMNELVTINVHSTTDENQSPQVIVNVNGTNQPIIRGYPTLVDRTVCAKDPLSARRLWDWSEEITGVSYPF